MSKEILESAFEAVKSARQAIVGAAMREELTTDQAQAINAPILGAMIDLRSALGELELESTTGNWIAAEDVDRLARELDVAMNGEEGAALAPQLCDVISQATQRLKIELTQEPVALVDLRNSTKSAYWLNRTLELEHGTKLYLAPFQRLPLTEGQRMEIIEAEFPLSLVPLILIQKIDAVCLALEAAHDIKETK